MQLDPLSLELCVTHCPNNKVLSPFITLESRWYCNECEDWHDCEEVGDFQIQHHPDNTISVRGYGYYELDRINLKG